MNLKGQSFKGKFDRTKYQSRIYYPDESDDIKGVEYFCKHRVSVSAWFSVSGGGNSKILLWLTCNRKVFRFSPGDHGVEP